MPALARRRTASAARRVLGTRWGRTLAGLVAAALAGVAALALAGGLRAAELEEVRAAPGEPVDLGPVRAAVLDHTVTDEVLVPELEDAGARAWLVVRVAVETVQDESLQGVPDLVALPDDVGIAVEPDDLQYPMAILSADGTRYPQLHPGLPAEILIVWPLTSADAVPEPLEVHLLGSERYFSRLMHGPAWTDEAPVARVEVPRAAGLPAAVLDVLRDDW